LQAVFALFCGRGAVLRAPRSTGKEIVMKTEVRWTAEDQAHHLRTSKADLAKILEDTDLLDAFFSKLAVEINALRDIYKLMCCIDELRDKIIEWCNSEKDAR
jgi:hypothetical protein